jgi:hypothetical protein
MAVAERIPTSPSSQRTTARRFRRDLRRHGRALEGRVGEQLLDRDVLVDDRWIAVGKVADAGRRAATTFGNRVTPAKLIHDRTCTRWGTA